MTLWIHHFNQSNYSRKRVHRIMKKLRIHVVIRKKKKKYKFSNPEFITENKIGGEFYGCKYIILVSRLNDLLVSHGNGLVYEYYWDNENYAQTIADTRHYYTHYGKSKEAKALKKDDLLEAIYIKRFLLEYHICLVLGIDNYDKIHQELSRHNSWKQLSAIQFQKSEKYVDK